MADGNKKGCQACSSQKQKQTYHTTALGTPQRPLLAKILAGFPIVVDIVKNLKYTSA